MANADGRKFNVDRWIDATVQRIRQAGNHVTPKYVIANGVLPDMTPKQLRRCKHKARKRNDWSIGLYVGDGYNREGY